MIGHLLVNCFKVFGVFFIAHYFEIYWLFWIFLLLMVFNLHKQLELAKNNKIPTDYLIKIDFTGSNYAILVGSVLTTLVIVQYDVVSAVWVFLAHMASSVSLVELREVTKRRIKRGQK
jgi:hypothetical protein